MARALSAVAVAFDRALRWLDDDLALAEALLLLQDGTVLSDAAISMHTALAAVQRADGRRMLTGGTTLR